MCTWSTKWSPESRWSDRHGLPVPETYQFIDELTQKLNLNLKTYRSAFTGVAGSRTEVVDKAGRHRAVQPDQQRRADGAGAEELRPQPGFRACGVRRARPAKTSRRWSSSAPFKVHPLFDWPIATWVGISKRTGCRITRCGTRAICPRRRHTTRSMSEVDSVTSSILRAQARVRSARRLSATRMSRGLSAEQHSVD